MSADPVTSSPPNPSGWTLEGRYEAQRPVTPGSQVQLVPALDTVLGRWVTLLLLPQSTSLTGRLALRFQLRRMSEVQQEHLAHVFDVVDSPSGPAVVLESLNGAVLLCDVPAHTLDHADVNRVVGELGTALAALRAAGLAHGAVSTSSVAFTADRRAVLLPSPPRTDAHPGDDDADLRALATELGALATELGATATTNPPSRTDPPDAPTAVLDVSGGPAPTALLNVPTPAPSSPSPPPVSSQARQQGRDWTSLRATVARFALVVAGGCAGALVADIASRLVG